MSGAGSCETPCCTRDGSHVAIRTPPLKCKCPCSCLDLMTDTVKIPRPKFPRKGTATGRIEHDARGNAVLKRTRVTDTEQLDSPPSLQLVDDSKTSRAKSARRIGGSKLKR